MHRAILLLIFIAFTTSAVAAEHAGAAPYKQKTCIGCHGADGSGNTPAGKAVKARDLRGDDVQKQSDADLAAAIANGRGKMPPFKSSLSTQQIKDLVAYIRTFKKE
jgi:mono/diheme cytochrome c family protein